MSAEKKRQLPAPLLRVLVRLIQLYVRYWPWERGKVRIWNRLLKPLTQGRKLSMSTTTRFGARMLVDLPDEVQTSILMTGLWEPHITAYVESALKPGDTFVDVGANVGYYSLLASKLVGEEGHVYAVEACPSICEALRANLDRNGCANVTVIHAAVGECEGSLEVWRAESSNVGQSTVVEGLAERDHMTSEGQVRSARLADLVPPSKLLAARLVKIDVEGSEYEVISGLLPELGGFSEQTEWIVELCAGHEAEGAERRAWSFNQFSSAGYSAYLLPNEYKTSFYLSRPGGDLLRRLQAAPDTRLSDVLFTKSS